MEQRTRIGVYGLCLDGGNVLLVQIYPDHAHGGSWTLPGGGMDFGEHPLETLAREFREETGLSCNIGKFLEIGSKVVDLPDERLHAITMVYRVEASGEPRVEEIDGTTVDARWIQLDEARGPLPTVPLVDRVLNSLH